MGVYLVTYLLFFVDVLCTSLCPYAHVCRCTWKYTHVEARGLSSVFLHLFFWRGGFVLLFVWSIGEHAMVCIQGLKDNLRDVGIRDLTQFVM